MFRFGYLVGAALLGAAITPASAQDHPDLGRFEGSQQVGYLAAEYDETFMIVGPVSTNTSDQGGDGWKHFEGRLSYYYYRLPDGRSSLEVQRNFESSLQTRGYDIAFSCATGNGSCFSNSSGVPGMFLGLLLDHPISMPTLELGDVVRNKFSAGNGRYTYARSVENDSEVHMAIAFSDNEALGRFVFAKIIESGEMRTGQIGFTEAGSMQSQLDATGQIDLYGIHFDFDSAAIRAESSAQLAEIAALLAGNTNLTLEVVGHTDNQGSAVYNEDLSKRRADAVVAALVGGHGIAPGRLSALGRGLAEPVASNDDEEGRALNRRVELRRR